MATRPQQRSNLQPENVDEGNHGQGRDSGPADRDDGDGVGDELSAEELAALDGMRTGQRDADGRAEPEPTGDDGAGDDDGDGERDGLDGDDGQDGVDAGDDQAGARDRDQGARDDRGQQGDGSQQRKAPKTINYGRHQREIGKRDARLTELQGLLDGERQKNTRLDERQRMLLEAINSRGAQQDGGQQQDQQQDQDPEPNGDEDPIGHLQWQNRRLAKQVQTLTEGQQNRDQRQRQQTEEEREIGEYTAEVEVAARRDPSVADAFVYLRESRYTELGGIYAGIDVNDPEQTARLSPQEQIQLSRRIQAAFANEQRMVYRAAKEGRRDVGQQILMLAKARGFNPKAQQQRGQQQDDGGADERDQDRGQQRGQRQRGQDGGRQQQAPRGQQRQQGSVSEEIDNIREAAGASKSLSDAGGSPGGQIDMQRLADMPDDEFEEILTSMSKGKFDRLMGKQPN